ncbi:MAG: heme o synthase [Myxococcota bacterium]
MSTPEAQILKQFEAAEAAPVPAGTAAAPGLTGTLRSYLALTKPRLLPMVLLTAIPTMLMAAGGWPPAYLMFTTILGTALAAGAANTLNCFAERERDALMTRTATRPLPTGRLTPRQALCFGVALAAVSTLLLLAATNVLAAAIALSGILFYVFVYTIWLKPRTPYSTVIGGAAGAIAPLIADAAVDGRVGPAGLLIFLIVFFWQPPHFWAISLYRKDEYAHAGFPMLPLVIGEDATRLRMLLYTFLLVPVTLAPVALGLLGTAYLAAALPLGALFIGAALRVRKHKTAASARTMFRVSLLYLLLLFVAMLADLTIAA